jgi:hypothetical protein
VGNERKGWTNGARQGLRFYAQCAREAWRRSWDVANAWPPILALLLLAGGAWFAGMDLTFPGDVPYGGQIGTGLFIVAAWLTVFLVQFVTAPPRLYARLDAELLTLTRRLFAPAFRSVAALPAPAVVPARVLPAPARPAAELPGADLPASTPPDPAPTVIALPGPESPSVALLLPDPPSEPQPEPAPEMPPLAPPPPPRRALPPIDVRLHDQVYETTAVDTTGDRLPASRAYMARITNRGDRVVRRCQLFFCNPAHIQVVSGAFDLAPGESRDLPVLRVIDEADEPHALLYFLDAETWQVAEGQAAWLPEPGRFRVKVLSANAATAALDVKLSRSAGRPFAWTLVEATGPDKAAKAGRRQSAWVPSDLVAEPDPGD